MKKFSSTLAWICGILLFVYLLVDTMKLSDVFTKHEVVTKETPIVLEYWEKWQNFEADAMRAIVDRFNAEKIRNKDGRPIQVHFFSVTEIDQKILLATAGGIPPDIAGLFDRNIMTYSERGALLPLDGRMKRDGLSRDDYLPQIFMFCLHEDRVWGMPAVPEALALYYNKKLFREAGLDPDKPPTSIAELDAVAEKLTKYDEKGNIVQLGFSPCEPGWWLPQWPMWFGGTNWDGEHLTCDSPQSMQAWDWIQSYAKKYTIKKLNHFGTKTVPFASSQNYFMQGKVAMELQGDYFLQFVKICAPNLELGIAPFPMVDPAMGCVTQTGCSILSIPKSAKHPDEAWEFIKYVQRQDVMEDLCRRQWRFSPLKKTSPDFYTNHPHPYIKIFRELAESPRSQGWPRFSIATEYDDELLQAIETLWQLQETPAEAMKKVKTRIQPILDRRNERWAKIKQLRQKEWDREDNWQ
ncbi:ABC transporter substrate-binding protein [Candidatus Sumerlaeota bacterium]|nr:ABC transporter substrate-binding protein [Candidatus Sumerlaeota bacterium]